MLTSLFAAALALLVLGIPTFCAYKIGHALGYRAGANAMAMNITNAYPCRSCLESEVA